MIKKLTKDNSFTVERNMVAKRDKKGGVTLRSGEEYNFKNVRDEQNDFPSLFGEWVELTATPRTVRPSDEVASAVEARPRTAALLSAPAPQTALPPVVIEQNYAPSAPSGYSSASFYRTPDFYLIAFNDHVIHAAISFRVEGDQIHWTTRDQEEKQAPLSIVDRRFSEQINRDRRVDFRLP